MTINDIGDKCANANMGRLTGKCRQQAPAVEKRIVRMQRVIEMITDPGTIKADGFNILWSSPSLMDTKFM